MAQYISKDALLADIEKVIDEPAPLHDQQCTWEDGYYCGLYKAESIIDTFEVKEVDLEKETTHYLLYEHRSPLNEIMHQADLNAEIQYHKDIENAFKAGFELGMTANIKTRKGEVK